MERHEGNVVPHRLAVQCPLLSRCANPDSPGALLFGAGAVNEKKLHRRHLEAKLAAIAMRRRELFFAAAAGYDRCYQLFSSDVRPFLRLAHNNLELFQPAESYFAKAFAAESKLGNVHAFYGFHFWRQRQLARAEAFCAKALSSVADNAIARAEIGDFRRLRALAADAQHVDSYGNRSGTMTLIPRTNTMRDQV